MLAQNVIKNSNNAGWITRLASSISIVLLTGCTTGHVKPSLNTLSTTYAVENGEPRYIYCSVGSSNTAFHTCPVTTQKTLSNKPVAPLTQNLPINILMHAESGVQKTAIESSDTALKSEQRLPDAQVVSNLTDESNARITVGSPDVPMPSQTTERVVSKNEEPVVNSAVASGVKESILNRQAVAGPDNKLVDEKFAASIISLKASDTVGNKDSVVVSNNTAAVTNVPVSVYFDFASYKISPKTLQNIVASLNLDTKKKIAVTGYTDDIGPKHINDALALRRAMSVMQMLIAMGVPDSQIEINACAMCGIQSVNGVTTKTRQMYRRVDITLVS